MTTEKRVDVLEKAVRRGQEALLDRIDTFKAEDSRERKEVAKQLGDMFQISFDTLKENQVKIEARLEKIERNQGDHTQYIAASKVRWSILGMVGSGLVAGLIKIALDIYSK